MNTFTAEHLIFAKQTAHRGVRDVYTHIFTINATIEIR